MGSIVRRTLSVHKEHDLLLKLETAGLTNDLAQRIIESKGNALAARIVKLVKDEKPEVKVDEPRRFTPRDLEGLLRGDTRLPLTDIGSNTDFWKSAATVPVEYYLHETSRWLMNKSDTDADAVRAQYAGVAFRSIMHYMSDAKVRQIVELVIQKNSKENSKCGNSFAISLLVGIKVCDYQTTQPEFFLQIRNFLEDILRSGNYFGYSALKDFFNAAAACDAARRTPKTYHSNCTGCGPNCDCKD